MEKRTHLDPRRLREWADWAQMAFIDALVKSAPWSCEQMAFHGGTSLHLSWNSPRFSEDLDFLLSQEREKDIPGIMQRVEERMRQAALLFDPNLAIEIRDRTKEGSRLIHYQIVVSSPGKILGNAMVKAEFWKVDRTYLADYRSEFVYPLKPSDVVSRVSQPLPAATLQSAFADKLTAFSTRPFLKWRDIFDLWWISKQTPIDPVKMAPTFLHHVSAYNTVDGLPPEKALLRLLDMSEEDIFSKADPDLRKWLPEPLWASLYPDGVREMVRYARSTLVAVSEAVPEAGQSIVKERARGQSPSQDFGL